VLTAIALMTVIGLLTPVYRLQDLSWQYSFVAAAAFVLSCAALGWLVWRLLLRRADPQSWLTALLLHILYACGFSLLWTVFFSGFTYLVRPQHGTPFLHEGSLWQFVWGFFVYAALAQAAYSQARLRERELTAAQSELQALRAQLNPHFLFNTLHSLSQLVREDPDAAQQAISEFGEMMRYSLSAGRAADAEVCLEEELEFIRHYLALERLRLGDRLAVVEDIDPEALELGLPPLLLQPLVENAVRHGLAPRRVGGVLRLGAQVRDSMLILTVADDGCGADPAHWHRAPGLGLQVVRRQLQVRFGDRAEFGVSTRPQAGFSVSVCVPARLPSTASIRWHEPKDPSVVGATQ
jgi:sensor histidine kinase YesM